jgi:predicted glycogen debranching enzyme
MMELGRDLCDDADNALRREWLITNGIGGYASSTIAGANTRRYHGVLIAALQPPLGRTLLLAKIDATAHLRGAAYQLDTNEWADGAIDPPAHRLIESFQLDGTLPTWTYALAEAHLVKRVWMAHGCNTTYVTYTHARGRDPIVLDLKLLCTYRDHHTETRGDWMPNVIANPAGIRVEAFDGAPPYFITIERGTLTPIERWYYKFKHRVETERGLDDVEDLFAAGQFHVTLQPGETVAVAASTEEDTPLNWQFALKAERDRQRALIDQAGAANAPQWIQQLVLAADQFIVERSSWSLREAQWAKTLAMTPAAGRTVIAGYPWFGDWGRDTMIALPGLCLTTKRYDIARLILATFASFVDQGMLPNRFPDQEERPEYNTVDATLWYFHAIDQVVTATSDWSFARELYPVLKDSVAWHVKGTRFNIHVDKDGLLYAGEPGVQLTWMDAKVDDWVVTPRIGKPVEINALWIHALRIMAYHAHQLGYTDDAQKYSALANRAADAFAQRFWYADGGYLYDVIDGPGGNDRSLRPNQLFALSLKPTLLPHDAAQSVVDVCARELLTSFGLRSLAPGHTDYIGKYTGDRYSRDGAYHQGTVWGWLIGPFVEAHFTVYRDREAARSFLAPFKHHLNDIGLGTISEVFDGDPPHTPRGCASQAWSVAEVLRVWMMLKG